MEPTPNSTSPPSTFHCMVLEDEPISATIISRVLQEFGAKVSVCTHIEKARSAIDKQKFDLLIFDDDLPDGTGTGFFYELKERWSLATVIMLTAIPNISNAVQLTRNGLFDYLTKPIRIHELRSCLRRAVEHIQPKEADLKLNDFVGFSSAMKETYRLIQFAAIHPTASVLLTGETGVGKDLTTRVIHQLTFQNHQSPPPFVAVNCSALPTEMVEAELFGAEKGAYTGAHQQRIGLAEAAQGGTLFLDEITEIPLSLQAKMLQFLENREYRRLGSTTIRRFDGRIIAATNKNLDEAVELGQFRADLRYRIEVFTIHLPPLRERKEDLQPLVELILSQLSEKYHRPSPRIKPEDLLALQDYPFPGNIRELRNLIERSLLQTNLESSWLQVQIPAYSKGQSPSSTTSIFQPWSVSSPSRTHSESTDHPLQSLPPNPTNLPSISLSRPDLNPFETQEYLLIQEAILKNQGVVRKAAKHLGITHQSLLRRLKKWPELHPSQTNPNFPSTN